MYAKLKGEVVLDMLDENQDESSKELPTTSPEPEPKPEEKQEENPFDMANSPSKDIPVEPSEPKEDDTAQTIDPQNEKKTSETIPISKESVGGAEEAQVKLLK